MRWLITGGAGFIGTALATRLWGASDEVYVVDIKQPFASTTQYWLGSICDRTTFQDLPPVDVVVHLAAVSGVLPSLKDPVKTIQTNVEGLTRCLDFARRCKARFLFASSGAVAGYKPESPYGASKAAGEMLCRAYSTAFDLPATILRLSSVYGPFSAHKESVVAKFCRRAVQGEPLPIRGNGQQTRDFVYVLDVVDAIQHLARVSRYLGLGPYGVASGTETTVLQIAERLAYLTGAPIQFVEALQGELHAAPNQTTVVPGWAPKTALDFGLKQTLRYFQRGEANAS